MKPCYKICGEQATEIVKGLRFWLIQLLGERENLEAAMLAIDALYRLTHCLQSRPIFT